MSSNAHAVVEFDCEGENTEHLFLATARFENQIMSLDMLQSTTHVEGPFPLLPLRYKLENLRSEIAQGQRVYKFAPDNYQDCDYRWLWPLNLSANDEATDSEGDLTTLLKLNCDGVKSEVEMECSRREE